ncbi:MAG TPA: hypothetical protein IAC84_01880 [Firmicutes bacterium]|nr:hypothetical protein [Candidatus Enterenecus merdae]HJH62010.1 hypothetical protein [Bacillota bacterium]
MGKKIRESKILYIFLSVLISIALWFYVTSLDGNEDTITIGNIPVTFSGVEALEQRGLMIVDDAPRVSVRISASPMVLARLDNQSLQATVDVSQISEAAQYTLAYTVSLPAGVSANQVQFVSGQVGNVSFTVARYASRPIEIQGQFTGTAAEGYLPGSADDFVFSPTTLTVSGQAELVEQISHALVTVDGEELTQSINGDFPYEFIDANGEPLGELDVEVDSQTVHVSFPIYATAEIPLEVTLVAGGGASTANASYTLSEDTILVAGSSQAVAAIQEEGALTIAAIDLATVQDGDELQLNIPLADELTNISGFTEVTVTIHLEGELATRTIETDNIEVINCPQGWSARVLTRVLSVEIRGDPELVDAVIEENVLVSVDLSQVHEAAGQYSMAATVYLNSVGTVDQIGVMNRGYEVVVELSRA